MYKDIISYSLAENISEKHLLSIANEIIDSWMKQQEGFISWEICKNLDGSYTDIVCWKSEESAKKAETDMVNIPNVSDWYACYREGSISAQSIKVIKMF